MGLSRLQQIFLVEETTEAVGLSGASLFASGTGNYLVIDPSLDFDVPYFERNVRRASLTPLQGLAGIQKGSSKFSIELTGTSSIGTPPPFGLPLRACGFRQETLIRIPIGVVTGGPFKHGETVSQATSSATGTVVSDCYTGQTDLWVTKGNGLGNASAFNGANIITGGTSGATVTPSGSPVTSAGIGWWPYSLALSVITFVTPSVATINDGDILQGATSKSLWMANGTFASGATAVYLRRITGHFSGTEAVSNLTAGGTPIASQALTERQFQIPTLSVGMTKDGVREALKFARGTVSFAGTIGEPMILTFEFKGAKNAIADGSAPAIAYNQVVPPVLLDADLALGHAADTFALEQIPAIHQFSLAINGDVQVQENMADATGLTNTLITARKPSGTFDPELIPEAAWPFLGDFLANTPFRARYSVGSALGNKFLMTMPGLSIQSLPTGDRNQIATRTVNFNLNGGSQGVGSITTDNEFVIIAQYA